MIVPMKKVSLIIREDKKDEALKKLRKLGIIHIEISEGSGERLSLLQEQISALESTLFTIGKQKKVEQKDVDTEEALSISTMIQVLDEEKKQCQAERISITSELDRLASWGDIDPSSISELESKGYEISFYEMPKSEYEHLSESVKTVRIASTKTSVRFMLLNSGTKDIDETTSLPAEYRLSLPQNSTNRMRVEKLEQELAGKAKICKINVDEAGDIASDYGVMSIPTFIVFKQGKPTRTTVGVQSEDVLKDMIK